MSLLWPEKVVGGLFHGQCWLKRKGAEQVRSPEAGADAPSAMLAALDCLLEEQSVSMRKGSKISLVVSDSLAALVQLAWHEQLGSVDEVRAYAIACFDKQGVEMDERWVMHAQFRRHGAMGLAYALPRAWIDALLALLRARGLVLDRVLPLSAQVYWSVPKNREQELVLLREARRTSALVYGSEGLVGMDAELSTGRAQESCQRLLARVAAYHPQIARVRDWSELAEEAGAAPSFIAECLPEAVIESVNRHAWS